MSRPPLSRSSVAVSRATLTGPRKWCDHRADPDAFGSSGNRGQCDPRIDHVDDRLPPAHVSPLVFCCSRIARFDPLLRRRSQREERPPLARAHCSLRSLSLAQHGGARFPDARSISSRSLTSAPSATGARSVRQLAGQNGRVTDAAERLRRRYPKSRMPRPLLLGLISVGVVLGMTWLVWTALEHSRPAVAAHVQAFSIDSDTAVSVTITVERRDPSVPATCRVLAQAVDFQPVGEQQVTIGASADPLVDVSLVLTTLRRATAVVVKGCSVS